MGNGTSVSPFLHLFLQHLSLIDFTVSFIFKTIITSLKSEHFFGGDWLGLSWLRDSVVVDGLGK